MGTINALFGQINKKVAKQQRGVNHANQGMNTVAVR